MILYQLRPTVMFLVWFGLVFWVFLFCFDSWICSLDTLKSTFFIWMDGETEAKDTQQPPSTKLVLTADCWGPVPLPKQPSCETPAPTETFTPSEEAGEVQNS